jgi:hypothetical protein
MYLDDFVLLARVHAKPKSSSRKQGSACVRSRGSALDEDRQREGGFPPPVLLAQTRSELWTEIIEMSMRAAR